MKYNLPGDLRPNCYAMGRRETSPGKVQRTKCSKNKDLHFKSRRRFSAGNAGLAPVDKFTENILFHQYHRRLKLSLADYRYS